MLKSPDKISKTMNPRRINEYGEEKEIFPNYSYNSQFYISGR